VRHRAEEHNTGGLSDTGPRRSQEPSLVGNGFESHRSTCTSNVRGTGQLQCQTQVEGQRQDAMHVSKGLESPASAHIMKTRGLVDRMVDVMENSTSDHPASATTAWNSAPSAGSSKPQVAAEVPMREVSPTRTPMEEGHAWATRLSEVGRVLRSSVEAAVRGEAGHPDRSQSTTLSSEEPVPRESQSPVLEVVNLSTSSSPGADARPASPERRIRPASPERRHRPASPENRHRPSPGPEGDRDISSCEQGRSRESGFGVNLPQASPTHTTSMSRSVQGEQPCHPPSGWNLPRSRLWSTPQPIEPT